MSTSLTARDEKLVELLNEAYGKGSNSRRRSTPTCR